MDSLRSLASGPEGSFVLTFGGALLAAALVPVLAAEGPVRILQPAAVAVVLAVGFVWRPAVGLLALAILILGYDTLALYVGSAVKRTDEMAIPLLVVIALIRFRPWHTWEWSWLRDGGIAVVVLAGLASSFVNGVPPMIWAFALVLMLKPIAVLFLALSLRPDRRTMIGAVRIMLSIGVVIAVLGLVEAFDQGGFQHALGLPEYIRPRGSLPAIKSLFTHPAVFAWFSAFLALYCFTGYIHVRRRALLGLGFLFGVTAFMAARRRTIAAALATIGLVFAWSVRRPSRLPEETRSWLPVFATTALIVVAFIPGLFGLYERTVDRYLPEPSNGVVVPREPVDDEAPGTAPARVALYRASVEIARDHFPLGAGMGRYGSWMSRVEYSPVYERYGLSDIRGLRESNSMFATDTFWPMVLGEYGAIGAAGFAAFLAGIGMHLWRAGRSAGDPMTKALVVGSLAVFAAAVIESSATPMFTSPPRSYLLFTAIGGSLAYWRAGTAASAGLAALNGPQADSSSTGRDR